MPANEVIQEAKNYRDKVSNVDKKSGKRLWIYAKKPKGKLYKLRSYVAYVYMLLFFSAPFIYINGNPLLMLNIPEGKFSLFGSLFWPQDFYIFGLGMLMFIVFIILFTLVFGRIFCGWICPQTIFMEMLFRKIEYWIEGDAPSQKLLHKQTWDTNKLIKKTTKHVLFLLLSFVIANTFLAYIIGKTSWLKLVQEPIQNNIAALITMLIFTLVFYGVYAYVREIVCTNVCPYGRLQGVLLDKNSIMVAYDYKRGEPRAKFKKNEIRQHGDCIDCHQCVDVCPTGIDIRNGTQLECINCTACIDACNFMMQKVGLESGLVRFASETSIRENKKLQFSTRIKVYTAILFILAGFMAFTIASRKEIDYTLLRAKGKLYFELGNNQYANLYNLRLINKSNQSMHLSLQAKNKNQKVRIVGDGNLFLEKNKEKEFTFFIDMDKKNMQRYKMNVDLELKNDKGKIYTITGTFLGPIGENY